MAVWTVKAVRQHQYEVEVEAEDMEAALRSLDDWIADDFEPFEVSAHWELEVN